MTQAAEQMFTLLSVLIDGKKVTYDELIVQAKNANALLKLSDPDFNAAVAEYQRVNGIAFPPAAIIVDPKGNEEDRDWFDKFLQANPKPVAFERYMSFLKESEHIGTESRKTIRKDIYRTVRQFANPNSINKSISKGLVVGDVQSGKTANYLGLINLAIDAGYRDVILLTGTTEYLREQTQDRTDKGLVGADSTSFLSQGLPLRYEGVGKNTKDYYAITYTNKTVDFTPSNSANLNFLPSDFLTKPRIYVVKKNKSVLDLLNTYLAKDKKSASSALLIIDDECDNASLNTRDPNERTIINDEICQLFDKFKICTYVGYTATPFANIFVLPDDEGPKKFNLFPSNFIVLLDTPDDYFGASKMFQKYDKTAKKGEGSSVIGILDSYEQNFLPTNHKKEYPFTALPQSLKDAIDIFLLGNVVRTLRGDEHSHRSMLVNISRYNSVQEDIANCISDYVHQLLILISQTCKMPFDFFIRDPSMKKLYDLWCTDEYFGRSREKGQPANKEYPFSKIQAGLFDEISKFEVAIVNLLHADQRYNYDAKKEQGARVIVVGGFTLSRGLTLYGLMVSYYNRHATAYDVLLQMGRWFGYRTNYEDLVKIFMTQESLDCYCVARDATEELKNRFRWMAAQNKTPSDFGLAVQESPDSLETSLLITARNKMKTGEDKIMQIIELSGEVVDTSKIEKSFDLAKKNQDAVDSFFAKIRASGISYTHPETSPERIFLSGVSKSLILDFLEEINVSPANNTFDILSLSQFLLKDTHAALDKWDVVVATGDSTDGETTACIDGHSYLPVQRAFSFTESETYVKINSGHNHIVDPGLFRIGLTKKEVEMAKQHAKKERDEQKRKTDGVTSRDYLSIPGRHPLLIVYPVSLKTDADSDCPDQVAAALESEAKKKLKATLNGQCLYGFAMGFPGEAGSIKAIYRINVILQKQLKNITDDSDEDEDLTAEGEKYE